MKKYNLITGMIYLGLTFFILFVSLQLELGALTNPGAGFFPFLSAVPLGVLSLALIISTLLGKEGGGEEAVVWPTGIYMRKIILTLIALIIYTILLNILGYFLSTSLLLLILLKGIEPQKWSTALLITLISVAGSYCIFGWWLDVPLPMGFWKG